MIPLLTATEAARALHVSRSLVYRLAAEGALSHYKVASKLLFSEEHLRDFLSAAELRRTT